MIGDVMVGYLQLFSNSHELLVLWLVFASSGDHLITNCLINTYCFLYLCLLPDILCCCLMCIASHHVLVVAYALKSI